jgi:hypothetical protein
MQPKYITNYLRQKLYIVKYFGGGVTMEYLNNLSIPEFLEVAEEVKIIDKEINKKNGK